MKNPEKYHMTCHNLSQKVWAVTLHISLTMKAISSAVLVYWELLVFKGVRALARLDLFPF